MKRYIAMLLSVVLLCSLPVTISAAVIEPVAPQWENVTTVLCSVDFSGTEGNISVYIRGKSGTTSISGTATHYRGNTEIESWSISGRSIASVSDTFTGISGSTYKLVLDVDVTTSGVTENIEEEDSARCPLQLY